MLRVRIIMLPIVDILLQRQRPRHIVNLGHVIAVQLQSAQELVEAKSRVSRHLGNADGRAWWVEGAGDDHPGDVVHRNHVDCVVDVGAGGELDAALDHSDEEVVGVCRCSEWLAYLENKDHIEGCVCVLPVPESPRTYPGRTIVPFRPLLPASRTRNSPAHLLWP